MVGFGERIIDRALNSNVAPVVFVAAAIAIGGAFNYGAGELADAMYGAGSAKTFLEESGYKDPRLESVDHLLVGLRGCSKTDTVEYEFETTAPNGAPNVKINVCKGILKGATIRQG